MSPTPRQESTLNKHPTSSMNTPEIVNVPYPTSRDIRNLLPFNPGVVADATGQVHVADLRLADARPDRRL